MAGIKPYNGITADTYNRLATDTGVVYIDYGLPGETILGATRGGNTFALEDEIREMLADGSPGPVKGSQRRVRTTAKLTVNLLELTTDALKKQALGSVSAVDSATHDKITRTAQIAAGDYIDNVTLVVAKNGTTDPFVFTLNNAMALNGLEFGAAEDDESVVVMEFTAHFDPDALDVDPWEIYNPLEGGIVRYTFTYTAGANGTIVGDGSQIIAAGADGAQVVASPDAGYVFVNWDDLDVEQFRTDLAAAADVTVVANFAVI